LFIIKGSSPIVWRVGLFFVTRSLDEDITRRSVAFMVGGLLVFLRFRWHSIFLRTPAFHNFSRSKPLLLTAYSLEARLSPDKDVSFPFLPPISKIDGFLLEFDAGFSTHIPMRCPFP